MKDSWSCLQTISHNIAGVDIQGDLKIDGLLGGHNLNEFKDFLYKSRPNIITGAKTFTDVTVTNDIVHDGKVNGLSDLEADLLFLDDTKTALGEFTFSEVEMKNLQVNGLVDGVSWSNLIANRLLRDAEQTISATYTFGSQNTNCPTAESCTRVRNSVCSGVEVEHYGYGHTEAECAAKCWNNEDCHVYSFDTSDGDCYAEGAGFADCAEWAMTWQWGTRECGAPNSCGLTEILFQGAITANDGDEDNAELNGHKISSIRTAENAWTAVGAVKVAAQAEANVLCHHVKDLNKAYLRNHQIDFVEKLDDALIDPAGDFQQVMHMDTLHYGEDIYLLVLLPSRLLTAKVTDNSIGNVRSHDIRRAGNMITSAYDFQAVSKDIRKSNDISFFIASDEGLSSFEVNGNLPTIQSKDFTLHFGSFPFRMACVDQTQTCFVAIQDHMGTQCRMRIVKLNPPVGSVDIWIGENYDFKMDAPDFDLIMIKEKLYFAISDRQNHKRINYLSVIEVDVTYPGQVGFTVNNTITIPISAHDFIFIAPRYVPLIVASKPEKVSFTLIIDF